MPMFDFKSFLKTFILFELLYYILLLASTKIYFFQNLRQLIFSYSFLIINLTLSFFASFTRINVYEYFKAGGRLDFETIKSSKIYWKYVELYWVLFVAALIFAFIYHGYIGARFLVLAILILGFIAVTYYKRLQIQQRHGSDKSNKVS